MVSALVASSETHGLEVVAKSSLSRIYCPDSIVPVTGFPALITPDCGSLPSFVLILSTPAQKSTVQAQVLVVLGVNSGREPFV